MYNNTSVSSVRCKSLISDGIPVQSGLFLLIILMAVMLSTVVQAASLLHPAIPLLDEAGKHVLDTGKPYSPKQSCGGCHDYDAITSAFHFQMGRDEASDDYGRQHGIENLVSPGYFGGYGCMGGSNPDILAKKTNNSIDDFADKGSAGLIQRCLVCHTGGGWMEKDRNGKRYDQTNDADIAELDGDYYNRGTDAGNKSTTSDVVSRWDWKKSGVVEADCFICHADFTAMIKTDPDLEAGSSSAYDHFRYLRSDVLSRDGGYFRYADSAILEFLNLKHADGIQENATLLNFSRDVNSADAVHSRTVPNYALNLSADEPVINWNAAVFDANRKVRIPMQRFPNNENCMMCHVTSNSRRGFYGFGEGANATYEEETGILEEDYMDDVHKGKTWTENGETRSIENCNACHARNYYKPDYSSVELDANHNFRKGNSDMDLRNDLDYAPNARSCEYCHNDAATPAIPSGQDSMLTAHLERWKNNGDMAGYTRDSLLRITQTHLDVISCQACHITDKKSRGIRLQIMYRYRQAENGSLKIVPYNPRIRYYWKDRDSGRILNKTERNSVFKMSMSMDGSMYGAIIDPETGAELGRVSVGMSHGSMRFGDPEDYSGYIALKNAYDKVLKSKGITNPDAIMVWIESNQYLMSHNTRPSVASLQCDQCHSRKSNGSFSALVSDDGLLGSGNIKTVTSLPDRRLIAEGFVVLDMPYMKMDDTGVVTENVADILYETRINPSMTILNAAKATSMGGRVKRLPVDEAANQAGIHEPADLQALRNLVGNDIYIFRPNYGEVVIRSVAIMPPVDSLNDLTFPTYYMQVAIASDEVVSSANRTEFGGLNSNVFSLQARDGSGRLLESFAGARVLLKLPYTGGSTDLDEIRVITSKDGSHWSSVDTADIVMLRAQTVAKDGFVLLWTDHFSYYTVADSRTSVGGTKDNVASAAGGGGGAALWLLVILILSQSALGMGKASGSLLKITNEKLSRQK